MDALPISAIGENLAAQPEISGVWRLIKNISLSQKCVLWGLMAVCLPGCADIDNGTTSIVRINSILSIENQSGEMIEGVNINLLMVPDIAGIQRASEHRMESTLSLEADQAGWMNMERLLPGERRQVQVPQTVHVLRNALTNKYASFEDVVRASLAYVGYQARTSHADYGDCTDYARRLQADLLGAGVKSYFVTGFAVVRAPGKRALIIPHDWVMTEEANETLFVDAASHLLPDGQITYVALEVLASSDARRPRFTVDSHDVEVGLKYQVD